MLHNGLAEGERVVILMKMHEGHEPPADIDVRTRISQHIFSAEASASDLLRLEEDPTVLAFTVSQRLPLVK